MATTYRFRPGTRIKGVKPGDAAAELERLRATHGNLTPEAVVDAAADVSSPIHSAFEWDDTAAAREHRLHQARSLIRAVVVVTDGRPESPMYVHVRTQDVREYQSTEVVVANPSLYAAALAELLNHLTAARRAVQELRRLNPSADGPGAVERVLQEADELARVA